MKIIQKYTRSIHMCGRVHGVVSPTGAARPESGNACLGLGPCLGLRLRGGWQGTCGNVGQTQSMM